MDQPTIVSPDHDVLIELRADVKNLNTNVTQFMTNSSAQLTDHEHRITLLEQKNDVTKGITSARSRSRGEIIAIATLLILAITAWATWLAVRGH